MDNPYAPPPRRGRPDRSEQPDGDGPRQDTPPSEDGRPAERPPQGHPPQGHPPQDRPQGPPQEGPPPQRPPRPPVPPPSEEAIALAGRRMRTLVAFGLAMLVTLLLPLPWQMGGGAFAIATVVTGVRAVAAATRARRSGTVIASTAATTMVAGLVTLYFAAAAALWPIPLELQRCQAQALTISAQHACEAQYQQAVADRLGGQFPGLVLTPTPSP